MRARPVRPNIYLPVVRFGVADSDWFTVLLISCAGYLLPVPFGITLLYVPLQMWTWLIVTAACIAFFNYIRIGRKPRWLPHKLRASCFHHRHCRALPNGKKRPFARPWFIKDDGDLEAVREGTCERITFVRLLLAHESQETSEERWNQSLLMTT